MFRDLERVKAVTAADIQRVAKKYLTEKNRTVGWRVQVEEKQQAGGEEEIDQQLLMQWIQSLPQEERMAIFQKFQGMRTDTEREAYGKELYERAKAAQGKK